MKGVFREMLLCPAQRGTHLLGLTQSYMVGQHQNLDFYLFFAHFHYFTTVWKWWFMKWTSSALRNVQISTKKCGNSSVPYIFPWISLFYYLELFLLFPFLNFSHCSETINTLLSLPSCFQNQPTSHPTKIFFQVPIYLLTLPLLSHLSLSL